MTVHYYRLRDYALQHPECSAIMRIIGTAGTEVAVVLKIGGAA